MRSSWAWSALILCWTGTAAAAETTIMRYVEFRDGSVLRLPVVDEERKITLLGPDGRLEQRTVRLSTLPRLTLAPERVWQKKRQVLTAVAALGSDEFAEREQAEQRLTAMGPGTRSDLVVALELFSDVEVRYRLERILSKWPAPATPAPGPMPFDVIGTPSLAPLGTGLGRNGGGTWGDAGEGGLLVQVDGRNRRLGRQDVRAMSSDAPAGLYLETPLPGPGGVRRIREKDFPRGCIEEPFEATPDGRKLVIGENIEKLFVSKGFTLSTSITTSFVSVNNFQVEGKSKGLSVATHQPLFHGEITIRFCQPGREGVPAGVNYFGCWMAIVVPNGTGMVAYDFEGRELGSIHTERGPHEFMALYSPVPMHRIKIVPNVRIDPDYTLDDFIYSPPQSPEIGHPEKYTVYFVNGERVLCTEVNLSGARVHLRGLPAGLGDYSRPVVDVIRVTTPGKRQQSRPPAGFFAELQDGSIVFAPLPLKGSGPIFSRRPTLLAEPADIVAIWKSDVPRVGWPLKVPQPLVWNASSKSWEKIKDVKLTSATVGWTAADGQRQVRPYAEVTALLRVASPPPVTEERWHVRTVQGEDIVLDIGRPVELEGKLDKELTAAWHGKPLKIPAPDLVSIFRMPKAR